MDKIPRKIIAIIVAEGHIGADASYYFTYFLDGTAFEKVIENFATDVTQSSENRVQGTFSVEVLPMMGVEA